MSIYLKYKNNKNPKNKEFLENNENTNNNQNINDDKNKENNPNIINNKEEKENKDEDTKKEEIVDNNPNNNTEELSQSIQNLLLDKDFAAAVVVKKENKFITNYHYATFKNSYGENTCYINVILHLLYSIDELEEFLSYIYKIDESSKESDNGKEKNDNINNENTDEINELLVSLGKILNDYDEIITEYNKKDNKKKEVKDKQVTVINTLYMRKILEKLSNNKFPLNTIADPVELFTFILDILNERMNGDTHKTFYLELIDEYICNKKGCPKIQNKYDKDNFMYHIYIDDILNYIQQNNLKVKDYKNKLFEISYKSFLSGNVKKCEKCNGEMGHNLICKNCPDYILINCVWRQSNPIVDDVMTFLFSISLKEELNNLFISQIESDDKNYYCLFGFILYSFTLSHYIICKYNQDKKVFVLLDDEIVKEFNNINELINGFTVESLKTTGKAFFYPVMLIYINDNIYNHRTIKINSFNEIDYQKMINKCNEAIYEYQSKNEINEEMKSDNYQKMIKEQREIEEEIKKRAKKEAEAKKKKEDNNLGNINKSDILKKTNLEKKEENNKEIKNEIIIINDEEEDNKNKKTTQQKEETKKINKSKEISLDEENIKNRSKSKKKGKEDNQKKEKDKEIPETIKDDNSNNIQKIDLNDKNKIKKTKTSKKHCKKDINQMIWEKNDNKLKNEEQIKEKKEGNENKNHPSKAPTKKKTFQKVDSKENKDIEADPKYLGKKINNTTQQNDRYNNYNKRGSNFKGNNNYGKDKNNYGNKNYLRSKKFY